MGNNLLFILEDLLVRAHSLDMNLWFSNTSLQPSVLSHFALCYRSKTSNMPFWKPSVKREANTLCPPSFNAGKAQCSHPESFRAILVNPVLSNRKKRYKLSSRVLKMSFALISFHCVFLTTHNMEDIFHINAQKKVLYILTKKIFFIWLLIWTNIFHFS